MQDGTVSTKHCFAYISLVDSKQLLDIILNRQWCCRAAIPARITLHTVAPLLSHTQLCMERIYQPCKKAFGALNFSTDAKSSKCLQSTEVHQDADSIANSNGEETNISFLRMATV